MLTFGLVFDLVDPPGFVKFSCESQENPVRYGHASKRNFELDKDSGPTCPSLRCPPCAFGVARREIEAAPRTRSYRGQVVGNGERR